MTDRQQLADEFAVLSLQIEGMQERLKVVKTSLIQLLNAQALNTGQNGLTDKKGGEEVLGHNEAPKRLK